jgi:hypothetical protein
MTPLFLAAAGIEEIIVVSIGLIIFVGNVISKRIRADATQPGDKANADTQAKSQRAARLEQLAAKRRAELQQLAAQRQQGQRSAPPTQPSNMDVQQSAQRQDAKTLYERRAAALRQMQQQQKQRQAPAPAPKPAPVPERHPAHTSHAAKHELSQVREREEKLQQQRAAASKQHEAQRRQHAQQLGSGVTQVSHTKHGDIEMVHRHIDDINPQAAPMRTHHIAALGGMTLNRESLRHALIMKEILDPPLALRKIEA